MKSALYNLDNSKSISDMLFDSFIVAMVVFFATLSDVPNLQNLYICLKGFGITFFTQLTFEKGIKKRL